MSNLVDLQEALEVLRAKAGAQQKAWDYYEGRHPLVYSSGRLKQVFRRLDARFTMNWCSVVVDATFERIRLKRLLSSGFEAELERAWHEAELGLEADEVHRSALVSGEGLLLVWRDGPGEPIEAFAQDGRRCHLFMDPDRPRRKRFGAKTWRRGDEQRVTLYYADRIEHFAAKGSGEAQAASFRLVEEGENVFGEVPLFSFRRERRALVGELESLYDLQDAVNKLLNDLMIGSEFGVFAQRYVVSNANLVGLKNSPSEIWQLPAGDGTEESTQVGQFDPVPLSNFLEPMADLAAAMAVISRTPKHYFLRQGGDPSGEALLAMEAPLVRKVERLQAVFGPVWAEVGRFLLRLSGIEVGREQVVPIFDSAALVNARMKAELREANVRAGMDLRTYLVREEGWTEAEVEPLG